jgi:WhiB family transcriptional regulator, redox-sensing transcriptional regulator
LTGGVKRGYLCLMRGIQEWRVEAVCHSQANSEIFKSNPKRAKRICNSCPVASECFQYALIYGEWGIWGGTTFKERQMMVRSSPQLQADLIRQAKSQGLYEDRFSIVDYLDRSRKEAAFELSA